MQPITAPISRDEPRDNRAAVVSNLRDALLLLVRSDAIRDIRHSRQFYEDGLRREQRVAAFGDVTQQLVTVVQEQHGIHRNGGVDQPTADVLNSLLRNLHAFDAPQNGKWVVRGQVVDASGSRDDIQVSVYDRDLFFRRDGDNTGQLLGNDVTKRHPSNGATGWFEIAYETAKFSTGDIERNEDVIPDLVFLLSKDERSFADFKIQRIADGTVLTEEAEVSSDDLILGIHQPRRVEEIRIVIAGGQPKPQLSEYERLIRAIEPLLPERAPADASLAQREALMSAAVRRFDEPKHRDISFVARETGLDRSLIQALVAAVRLALVPFRSDLPVSVFYGLARTRAAADVLALGRLSADELYAGLKEASVKDPLIIPPFEPTNRLDEAVKSIRDILASYLPTYRSAEGAPSLADLMGADLPDAGDLATLWRTHSDHAGSPAEFWQKLTKQPGFQDAKKIAKVQYAFQLGALAQNNIALVNAVRTKYPEVTNTKELAFRLTSQDNWRDLLDAAAVPIPADVPGKPEERKANYAASLAGALEVAHPSVAVANMVASLPATQLANTQPAVSKFLADAVRKADFDLVTGRIDQLVADHGGGLLEHLDAKQRAAVIDQTRRLQRLFRLSTGPDSMKALLDAGFNSARDLAELPSDVAMDMLKPALGEATARLVLNRARNISAAAVHHYVFLNDAINSDVPRGAL